MSLSLLIVEDDVSFGHALKRSFERRDYRVHLATGVEGPPGLVAEMHPDCAIVDLKLGTASGLEWVRQLHRLDPLMKIVVLTGFASITTAVEAIKLGACHYLAKPANADDIEAAFSRIDGDSLVSLSPRPTSLRTLEWERIHEVLAASDFNLSKTARRLGMHRRTLARKLAKRQVP